MISRRPPPYSQVIQDQELIPSLDYEDGGELRQVALVSIGDTGVGIEPSDQERIFEMFAQVDAKESRSFSGTGIGLTIAKELVELHGGFIWVNSTPGEGSTFYFTLPRTIPCSDSSPSSPATSSENSTPSNEPGTTTPTSKASVRSSASNVTATPHLQHILQSPLRSVSLPAIHNVPPSSSTSTTSGGESIQTLVMTPERNWILVVDDEQTNRLILKTLLKPLGLRVVEACNGKEALEKCLLGPPSSGSSSEKPKKEEEEGMEKEKEKLRRLPNLVLLDLMMPGMSGWMVCCLLRERYSPTQLPIVMISACSSEEDKKRATSVGANYYMYVRPCSLSLSSSSPLSFFLPSSPFQC
jgi:two-component system sensor histidine kinase ChiS